MSLDDLVRNSPLCYERQPIPSPTYKELWEALKRWAGAEHGHPWVVRHLTPPKDGWCVEILIIPQTATIAADAVDEEHGEPGFYVLQAQIGENTPWVEIARVEGNEP